MGSFGVPAETVAPIVHRPAWYAVPLARFVGQAESVEYQIRAMPAVDLVAGDAEPGDALGAPVAERWLRWRAVVHSIK